MARQVSSIWLVMFPLLLADLNLSIQAIQFPEQPALSPDGKTLFFSWNGDLWQVPSQGGTAQSLTRHPAAESQPKVSPDGKRLAFVSNRTGTAQVYVSDLDRNLEDPIQLTRHSAGYSLEDWYPDGQSLLVSSVQDDHWRHAARFFKLSTAPSPEAPKKLFNAYGASGRVSPNGHQILFTREGYRWWRKGYRGSKSAQIWTNDLNQNSFQKHSHQETESLWPLWDPSGRSFYFVSGASGSFNLWIHDIDSESQKQITTFTDDSTVYPSLSRDGSTLVFRHLAHLYRMDLHNDQPPIQIEINIAAEARQADTLRRTLEDASEVAFSHDGLEIAFISGGDVWIMDTELREPKQITHTVEDEHSLIFGPDDESVVFVSLSKGQSDIWMAERGDSEAYWWQNDNFLLTRLTHDPEVENDLQLSPAGDRIAYLRKNGDLWTMEPNGQAATKIYSSVLSPTYDWSPDGKWLVLADSDADFNRDIWILPVDGSAPPFNLSRHPDNEDSPKWSPDGKLIAFTGERFDQEVDIYYVWLEAKEDEQGSRDRRLMKAIEKMKNHRKSESKSAKEDTEDSDKDSKEKQANSKNEGTLPTVAIDFEKIHERIRRISIPNTSERQLFWSPESDKLGFSATIDGKSGTYTVSIPDDLKPKLLTEKRGTHASWIKRDDQIFWLTQGKPGLVSKSGKTETFPFKAKQSVSRSQRFRAGFEQAWRLMRDHYYDPNLGNRNWQAIRRKYTPLAEKAVDVQELSTVIQLMLGELNGSHLGFTPARTDRWKPADDWNHETAHLGLRFDESFIGPGLKVKDRLPNSPADQERSRIEPGEVILRINQSPVDVRMDLTGILNGPLDRQLSLRVAGLDGAERDVKLRPISYSRARSLLYEKWVDDNRAHVGHQSDNQLGYLHVRAMNWSSFQQFEREIYAAGSGRDGLIIDVRENGGGFTTDHLLTVLTQPKHAITVPRGGGKGYPQDRSVYATWKKPIIVLCNQNSFSNAEIFSHAIKHLKRGQLVGVPTAGGVISTGSAQVMDLGRIRMPFRGWYLAGSGEDMELHGAVPDHILWPAPGELPSGTDRQLDKAIEVLSAEVAQWKAAPSTQLLKASERAPKVQP